MVYNNFSFNKLNINDKGLDEISKDTIYKHLYKFFNRINEFKKVKPRKYEQKEKVIVEHTASELYNKWIMKLDEKNDELSDAKKKKFC